VDPKAKLVERIRLALSSHPEVLEAYLFGSRARGDAQPHSDIDVAVYVSEVPDAPFGYQAELTTDLIRALAANDVDVVILNHAGPVLYHRVLRDGVRVVAQDLRATTVREGRALSRHCDYVGQIAKIDAAGRARTLRGELGR